MNREWKTLKEYEDILFEFYNGIARITINRPQVRNAFTPRTVSEMSDAFYICRERRDVRVVVLTGAGLVALFRYWNIIQYYFPNRHLIDDNWHDVLREFIPQFLSAKDKYEYKYSVLALWAKIKDSHAFIAKWDKVLYEISGYRNNSVPVGIKFVENKAVITEYFNQDLGKKTGLLPGDIIETIDGVSVEDIVKERLPITPGSNYTTQLRNIASYLLMSNNNEIQVKYKRNDLVETKTITCYSDYSVDLPYIDAIQTIDSDITYIYPGISPISRVLYVTSLILQL